MEGKTSGKLGGGVRAFPEPPQPMRRGLRTFQQKSPCSGRVCAGTSATNPASHKATQAAGTRVPEESARAHADAAPQKKKGRLSWRRNFLSLHSVAVVRRPLRYLRSSKRT